jgi:hypothetical protein
VRIHLAGEHALEFELVDAARITLDVLDDRVGGVLVVFQFDQLEQFARADEAFAQVADPVDRLVQQRTLAAQRLRAFGVVPDIGVFQFAVDFFQTLDLGVVVKETPGASATGR